jgi:DcmR-like sensory protein
MSNPVYNTQHHAVQFYHDDTSLFTTVGGFLSQGLIEGQSAILIATELHRTGILDQLRARLIDVERAQEIGILTVLDAREALSQFMLGETPNARAFEASIGRLVGKMVKMSSGPVRAYGEMVDLLWREGLHNAAIRLEILWNKLAATHGFALLCGYAMGSFYKETERQFEEVCRQHTHVMPPDPSAVVPGPKTVQ